LLHTGNALQRTAAAQRLGQLTTCFWFKQNLDVALAILSPELQLALESDRMTLGFPSISNWPTMATWAWAITTGITLSLSLGTIVLADGFSVYNDATGDFYLSQNQPGNVGDAILWHSELQTSDGTVLGLGAGECVRLNVYGDFFCNFIIQLDQRGTISGSGIQRVEPLESTFPITGGTGEFEGASGKIRSLPVESRARFRYDIDIVASGAG